MMKFNEKYKEIDVIGKGGFSSVYKVANINNNKL